MKYLIIILIVFEFSNHQIYSQQIKITNLGCRVNCDNVDYAPVISPDGLTLYYVSVRPGSKISKNGDPSHDFWAVEKLNKYDTLYRKPFNIDSSSQGGNLNTPANEGTASFTADGKTIFFTSCDNTYGYGSCDIYTSKWTENGWSKPQNLGSGVNSSHWDTQPSISPDGLKLYFISDRPGPNGNQNLDIWFSVWNDEDDEWGKAENLTLINSRGKETSPFIASDNITLFFASDGHKPNIGGLDFYLSRYTPEYDLWSEPANLGEPLNTESDEQFLSLPASGDLIYFASEREDLDTYCGNLDLYMAFVPSYFQAIVLNVSVADDFTGDPIYSKVKIINPVTGRIVKDRTFKGKDKVSMVISKTDFGNSKDSVPFVDFEISADNDKYGKTKKILRVKNPDHKDFNDLRDYTDKIGVTLEYQTKEDKKVPRKSSDFSILTATSSIWGVDNDLVYPLDTLKIEEMASVNMYPLLNYIFFDDNDFKLPQRYYKLKNESVNQFNLSLLNNKGVMFVYRNILNIIGLRMKENSNANLTLVGCNSNNGIEKKNLDLSNNRANTVKDYLVNNWSIPEERIIIKARNLPEKSSSNDTNEGIQENRRVEIYSDNNLILAPIIVNDTVTKAIPPIIRFKDAARVKFGESFWEISLKQNGSLLKEFVGEGNISDEIDWNINEEKTFPTSNEPIYTEFVVNDKAIQKTIVAKDTLSVLFLTLAQKEKMKYSMNYTEKYSLILFDFSSDKIDKTNSEIIKLIYSKITPTSNVKINGYTDLFGNDKFNLNLSKARAKSVFNMLNYPNAIHQGFGETIILFENELPEGRFYSRTVDIIIEHKLNN